MKEQDKNNTEAFNMEQEQEELQDTLLEGVTGGDGTDGEEAVLGEPVAAPAPAPATGGSKRPVVKKPTSYPVRLL